MLKEFFQGVSKFFTNERIMVLVIFLILVWGLLAYSGSKSLRVDTFDNVDGAEVKNYPTPLASSDMNSNNEGYTNEPVQEPAVAKSSDFGSNTKVTNPSDLLPNDQNSQWTTLNPNAGGKGDVLMPDMLQAGYHYGVDTIGQTLRNANLQYRSDPIIPKTAVGPWNQSTIEPDLGRVPLELGAGAQ